MGIKKIIWAFKELYILTNVNFGSSFMYINLSSWASPFSAILKRSRIQVLYLVYECECVIVRMAETSIETRAKAVTLYERGLSYREVAAEVGVSVSVILLSFVNQFLLLIQSFQGKWLVRSFSASQNFSPFKM